MALPKQIAPFSKEQTDFFYLSHARQNWAHGPVRAGKNFVINLRMAAALKREPVGFEDSDVAFCGASKTTIERIFLRDLFNLIGKKNYKYDAQSGKGRLFNRRDFYLFGYSDAASHTTLSGATLGLAYVTEGVYGHPDFHKQLTARLSLDDDHGNYSMLFGDTNPSGPYHWLWTDVINNAELLAAGDVLAFPFNFDSNLSLKPGYKEQLKRQYKPGSLWYMRMILGLWVTADGLVYQSFTQGKNTCRRDQLPAHFDEQIIAIDYGTNNPFAALLIGIKDGVFYVIDEYWHNGAEKGQKTNLQYADELCEWISGRWKNGQGGRITRMYIDPSAASFKTELANHARFQDLGIWVHDAVNDQTPGLQTVDNMLHMAQLVICELCTNTLREISTYAWCPKAAARGEDVPIKKNDHSMDALRYACHSERSANHDQFSMYGIRR